MDVAYILVVLSCVILYVANAKKQAQLQIIPEYVPEDCYKKTSFGDTVMVHYTGSLESGQVFDSSRGRGEPFGFVLGQGRVIPGWEQGLLDMCIGERRKLVIPSHLAYGKQGSPPAIPPDATLIFETELMDVQSEEAEFGLWRLLRFLGFPLAAGLLVYYLYNKYQDEASKQQQEKEERRSKKKRR